MFKGLSLKGLNIFKSKIDIWFDKAIEIMKELDEKKVDKISGKGLSANDFTDAYKEQLDNMGESSDGGFATIDELELLFKEVYTVNFFNGSVLLQSVTVEKGSAAIYTGSSPARDGYFFTGWDKDISNIQSNLDVYAQFKPKLNGGYFFITFPMVLNGINDNADELSFNALCNFENLMGGSTMGDTFNKVLSESFNGYLRYLEFVPISPETESLAQALMNGSQTANNSLKIALPNSIMKILGDDEDGTTSINTDIPIEGVNISLDGIHCDNVVPFGSSGAAACLSAESFKMSGGRYAMNTVIMGGALELWGEGPFEISITGKGSQFIHGVCVGVIPTGETSEADKNYITELFKQSCQNPDDIIALLNLLK